MNDKISALMDGELGQEELEESLRALREGGEPLETWRRYHLISDAFRDTQILSSGFSSRFAERLALEPTILAPANRPAPVRKETAWFPLSAAASVAAVAAAGLVGLASYQFLGTEPQPIALKQAPARVKPAAVAVVPMPGAVNDYLLAHQNYSPRSNLQGVAPYVRTVSEPARQR